MPHDHAHPGQVVQSQNAGRNSTNGDIRHDLAAPLALELAGCSMILCMLRRWCKACWRAWQGLWGSGRWPRSRQSSYPSSSRPPGPPMPAWQLLPLRTSCILQAGHATLRFCSTYSLHLASTLAVLTILIVGRPCRSPDKIIQGCQRSLLLRPHSYQIIWQLLIG